MIDQDERTKRADEKFCYECGAIIRAKAEICPKCGVRQPFLGGGLDSAAENYLTPGQPRSRIVAGVLAVVAGGIGLHKFYLGRPGWGIVYILLIWTGISVVLGLIEGIYLLTMREEAFLAKYAGPAWGARPKEPPPYDRT